MGRWAIKQILLGSSNTRCLLLKMLFLWLNVATVNTQRDRYSYPRSVRLRDGDTFDYIVVGAGAAGSVVSARLALAGQHVLLVEAGGDPGLFTKVPAAALGLLNSDMDWHYETITNNVSCLSSLNKACAFARGKCLGGSTSINFMLYTRGNRIRDFEEITYPGWTFDDLMPYFLRYEGLQDLEKFPPSSIPYHNTTGTMRIEYFDDPENPWHSRLQTAYGFLNFPQNSDVNAASQIGVSQLTGYVYQGERMSTARGYLAREDVKSVLKVVKNTFCTGVIVDDNRVVRGVTAIHKSRKINLFVNKEVILSAGTIGTPQILMLSGIGPADHLNSMGIPVKVDLPVGDDMIDHASPMIFVQVNKGIRILDTLRAATSKVFQLTELLLKTQGALTSNGLTDISAFVNTHCYDFELHKLVNQSFDGSNCEVPNLQIIHAFIGKYLLMLGKALVQKSTGFDDNVIDQLAEGNAKSDFITMSLILLDARSKGTVRLASTDPRVYPAVFPNYLSVKRDVEEMVRFIKIVEQLMETLPFKRENASILRLKLPGCPLYEEDKDGYWRCYVHHMTYPIYHAAGTAQFKSVVGPRLQVLNTQKLRVVDLSVLPRPTRASTESATIAVAERAVEFILEDNKDTSHTTKLFTRVST